MAANIVDRYINLITASSVKNADLLLITLASLYSAATCVEVADEPVMPRLSQMCMMMPPPGRFAA